MFKRRAKQNRELALINAQNTQNENRAETITLVVPEEYEDYNKKIVFVTDDGTVWDVITNNEYKITNAITKYKQVDFYIWLTKEVDGESIDFRTKTKTLSFYHNEDASDEITDEEIHGVNTVVNLLEEEIEKVENLNIEATKIGSTTTVTITKKDGTTESVEINDGVDGKDGEDGKDAKINGKNSIEIEAGNNITIDNTETGIRINSTNDGGTTDYTDLENKPKINNVELSGNKSLNDLGIQPKGNYIEDNNYVHTDNNFNNTYKNKLEGLENYDDTEVKEDIADIQDEQTEQNTDIEKLQTENARLKATLPTTTGEGQDITLDNTAEFEFIKPPLPMGNSEQGILPEQYQQVEYIESTGTQYINTNYTPVENDDINIEKVKNTGTGCLFSAGNSTNQLILLASSSTNYYWKYFAAGNATAFFTEELSNFSTISIANGSISINNVVKASSTYAGTVDTTIQLFRRVNGESYATASIGRFTITNGNKTKLDLIPCYRISDNEVGMYDLVSNTFYTNAGTGTFNKGNNTPNPNYEQPITNVTGDVEVVVSNADNTKQQTFTFPLGNEKLMLGDYLADDGIHHVRGQVVFDGTENWQAVGDDVYLTINDAKGNNSPTLNNFFKYTTVTNNTWGYMKFGTTNKNLIFYKAIIEKESLEGFKEYLTQQYQDNSPIVIQYELAEELIVPYTSAQQEVYNQIKQAISYEEQTNISSNQNALFSVEAYQDSKVILAEKYVKPSTGIPKADLSSSVQTSLGKADTALQSHQDISGKLDTSKVKNSNSTTAGDVYDVRYINTMIGDVETVLTTLTTGSGV